MPILRFEARDEPAKIGKYRVRGHIYRHASGRLASGRLVDPTRIGDVTFDAGHYLDLDEDGRPTAGRAGGVFVRVSPRGEVTPVDLHPINTNWETRRDGVTYSCSVFNGEFCCGGSGSSRVAEWGTSVPVREFLAGTLQDFVREHLPERLADVLGKAAAMHRLMSDLTIITMI